jgi:hypothetical protein
MIRFFRTDDAAAYESARLALDSVWGHVAPTTCIAPLEIAPRDSLGRVVLAVNGEFCQYAAAAQMLEHMLGTEVAAEITAQEYKEAVAIP